MTKKKDSQIDKKTKEGLNSDNHVSNDNFDIEKELEDLLEDNSFSDKLEEMGLNKHSREEMLQEYIVEKDREIADLKSTLAEKDKQIEKLSNENERLADLVKTANRQREHLREQFNQQAERKIQKFVKEHYLPTVDSLENALNYIQGEQDIEGIKGILTNCYNDLASIGIVKIDAEGEKFDPEYHNALAISHDREKADNTVLIVQKVGYKNDKTGELVRPAEVIVNKLS